MEKETINLTDIISVLGTRPAGMSETMKEYLHELTLQQEKEAKEKAAREAEEAAEEMREAEEAMKAETDGTEAEENKEEQNQDKNENNTK